jgi:aquaporin Z
MLKNIEQSPHLNLIQKLLAETLGTFILVFSVGVTQSNPTSVAASLWGAMLATGFISGAQFNPAVSLAVFVHATLSRAPNLPRKLQMSLIYMVFQMAAGLFGGYMAYKVINTNDKELAYFTIKGGITDGQGFLAEFFFTTMLTGCAVIGANFTKSNILAGGVVATTVMAGGFAVGPYTGGCFNPAVGFGINIIHYAVHQHTTHKVWLFMLAPAVGGIAGGTFASLFMMFRKDMHEQRKKQY